MKMEEIRAKAKELGVKTSKLKKAELILKIQAVEGNEQCYGTTNGSCPYTECCFRYDCFRASRCFNNRL